MSADVVSITALSSEAEELLAADAFNVDVEGFEGRIAFVAGTRASPENRSDANLHAAARRAVSGIYQ